MRVGPHPHALALGQCLVAWGPTPKPGCSVAFATLHRLKAVLGPKTRPGSFAPCPADNRPLLGSFEEPSAFGLLRGYQVFRGSCEGPPTGKIR